MADLDKGSVEIIDAMGDDYLVLKAARTSTGADASKGEKKDRGLIRYLYRNEHMTPFEFPTIVWYVKCPVFVARQIFRHRAFSFNERSARYKEIDWEVHEPSSWRVQDIENKQSSSGEFSPEATRFTTNTLHRAYSQSQSAYESILNMGAAREQARTVAPMGVYTEFYMRTDLRNLFHFLELRLDTHAQKEIREYATQMLEELKLSDRFPWSIEIFEEMRDLREEVNRLANEYKNDLETLHSELSTIK